MKTYSIGNMDCANCASEVENGVARLDGVNAVRVEFATGRMMVEGDVPFAVLKQRVEALGKTLDQPADPAADDAAAVAQATPGGLVGFWRFLLSRNETRLALIGGALTLLTLLLTVVGLPAAYAGVLYTVAMLIALWPIARSGANNMVINRRFNINLLMTIAAIGAILIGEYLEASTVIFLFAIGEAMEGYATERARRGLRGLMALRPRQALRVDAAGETLVPVETLAVDDTIAVKPGDQIPMDGEVVAGSSAVNQATITGESLPVDKVPGDSVYAGTINGEGALRVRVTHLAQDNTLSRLIRLVEEAQSSRAPVQRMIDRFAAWYTPGVVVLAALVAVLPPLLTAASFTDWLYRALTMLVIACPCALVISTPVSIISAVTAAARQGVLVKGGAFIEALARADVIAFDKTGTLTRGEPVVTEYRATECATDAQDCDLCTEVLALAAAVERGSEHPLAQAVVDAAEGRGAALAEAESVRAMTGRGVQGVVDGRMVTVGSHALFDAEFPHSRQVCAAVNAAAARGQTTLMLHDGSRVSGYIAVADEPRAESAATVSALNTLNLRTVMLTGDNAAAAHAIGASVGVRDVRASLLPEQKVEAVRALRSAGHTVAMVGDGINDTPALAAADIGIAMGGAGSAQALETADIALMADDISRLPYVVRLARMTNRIIHENIVLTFLVKAVFLLLAFLGLTTMWAAIFADVGMLLLVVLNGMRPLTLR
ncbi:MAG: heavy metal translocating P-type ATPase [Chloroflexota bacterium]